MATVPWVCGACRSINQPRETRCYRCRTPRDLGEVDPETLITAGAGSKPEGLTRPVGAYQSSRPRALLTEVLIVVALAVTVVSSFLGADLVGRFLDAGAFEEGSTVLVAALGLTGLGLAGLALLAWAAWLSRVVANVPTVGLGWPNVTPTAAIYESIFPGVNLYRVPSILRDIATRLEPNGRGEALIAASWLALVGGAIMPRVLRLGSSFLVGDIEELTRLWVVINQLGLGLTVAGGAFLIVLIEWIETRMAARAATTPPPDVATTASEPAEPTRAQTIAEAAGTALSKPSGTPGGDPAWAAERTAAESTAPAPTAAAPPAAAPSAAAPTAGESVTGPTGRPRWGGAVATPTSFSSPASPDRSPEHGPQPRPSGDPDDWPIGTDEG